MLNKSLQGICGQRGFPELCLAATVLTTIGDHDYLQFYQLLIIKRVSPIDFPVDPGPAGDLKR